MVCVSSFIGSKYWRNGRQQLTQSAQPDCSGWAGDRFGGPTCGLFLNNTSNYLSRIVTSGSRSGGCSDRVNIQHAGRSFEEVLFRATLGGQTKIQHDAMQDRRTSVPGFTALPLPPLSGGHFVLSAVLDAVQKCAISSCAKNRAH